MPQSGVPSQFVLLVTFAEAAVALARETDWLTLHAETLETFVLVGGPRSNLDEALDLCERKGNLVGAGRLRRLKRETD